MVLISPRISSLSSTMSSFNQSLRANRVRSVLTRDLPQSEVQLVDSGYELSRNLEAPFPGAPLEGTLSLRGWGEPQRRAVSGPLVFGLSKGGLQVLDAPEPACPTYERRKEVQLNAGISLAVVSRASGVLTVHCSLISSEFSPL